jgi:hypothetical protein
MITFHSIHIKVKGISTAAKLATNPHTDQYCIHQLVAKLDNINVQHILTQNYMLMHTFVVP